MVGVYLVFATLILPALAIRHLGGDGLVWGYLVGLGGYGLGLLLAALFDLPAGAVIVCTLALSALLCARLGAGRLATTPTGG